MIKKIIEEMKLENEFKCGGKDVTFDRLKKKVKDIQEKKEKTCGKCKFILPHRKDRFGFDANCKEIVVKSEITNVVELVHINKEDNACDFFEPKE